MATRVCWYCDAHAHMQLVGTVIRVQSVKSCSALFTCANCGQASLGITQEPPEGTMEAADAEAWLLASKTIVWFPKRGQGRAFEHVPRHIASAASEAHECHSVKAYRASVLLARSVIEATAKDSGIPNGTLQAKIDAMEQRDLIRPNVKVAAHEIRYLGNEMAHGDYVETVTEEESSETLGLMDIVLNEVYQEPAMIAARRQARLAKKSPREVVGGHPAAHH